MKSLKELFEIMDVSICEASRRTGYTWNTIWKVINHYRKGSMGFYTSLQAYRCIPYDCNLVELKNMEDSQYEKKAKEKEVHS